MSLQNCPMCTRWESEADLRIIELKHSYVTLNRDQFFSGYTLLFTKQHVTELFHLDRQTRGEIIEEVNLTAKILADIFKPDKVNYELLGNMVEHMHWHIIPRFKDDPLWPRPIWSEPHQEQFLSADAYAERIQLIRRGFNDQTIHPHT